MKKVIALLLTFMMIFSLAACGEKNPAASDDGEQTETITLGKHTAVFKGYTLTKDDDGNDAMVLTYDYTNGSKDEQSFAWAFLYGATQAGEELGSPMYDENYNQITKNYEEMVQKGQTLEVAFALTLVNTMDDVTIVFSDFDDHEYTQTVKLSGSSGTEAGPEEVGSYKLYEMTYEGETFDNAFLESVGMDMLYTLNLSADGTGVLKLEEDESPVTWKDGAFTVTASGAVYTYEFRDGMITLTETTGDTMVFQKTVDSGASGGLKPVDGGQGDRNQADSEDYWSGDWYGWWQVTSADGYWENFESSWFDCCAQITKYDDANGYIVIWDEDGSGNYEYMAECSVSFGAGTTEAGCMMSESGAFWLDDPIEHADWIVDPGASVVSQYDHMICIDGTYEDPENGGGFDYKFYLRPWGMDWEDVAADDPDMLPYTYESWYLPALEAGIEMPDKIGSGDFLAPGEVPDDQMEGQGTVEEIIPDSGTLGEYGFSVADATGVVPLETLKAAFRYMKEHTADLTYGALYAQMGNVHGVAQISGSVWQSGNYEYKWSAESGEYLYVTFSVDADGNELLKGYSSSLGLGD